LQKIVYFEEKKEGGAGRHLGESGAETTSEGERQTSEQIVVLEEESIQKAKGVIRDILGRRERKGPVGGRGEGKGGFKYAFMSVLSLCRTVELGGQLILTEKKKGEEYIGMLGRQKNFRLGSASIKGLLLT